MSSTARRLTLTLLAASMSASPISAVYADPMETQSFAGPYSVYISGDPSNTTLNASFTAAGYAAGGVRIDLVATGQAAGTLISDVTVLVTPPFGEPFEVSMGDPDPLIGSVELSRIVPLTAGTTVAGTWTFRFYDASQQGDGVSPEASVSNVSLSIETASTPPFVTDLGPLPQGNTELASEFHGAGSINWFKFTVAALDDIATPRYLDITTTGTFADSYIGLYDNFGRLRAVDDDSGTGRGSFLSFGYGGGLTVGGGGPSDAAAYSDGRSGKLGAGTYWLAVSEYGGGPPVFHPGWNVSPPPEGAGFTYTLFIALGATPGGGSPPAAESLGALAYGATESAVTGSGAINTGQVAWFTFTTGTVSASAGTYLDIVTTAATTVGDPELALYTAGGVLAGADDDDGPDVASFLSFGAGGGSTTGESPLGAVTVSDGRDGNLAAGAYYLAGAEFNSVFQNAFAVTQVGGEGGGALVVQTRSGAQTVGCGPADVGGTGGVPGADGALDNNDFVVYIDTFFAHAPAADIGSTGGVPGADGAWDNNDFVVFIDQFFSGC
ncbi:MAG TPA: GC-type dockerin domain-anchored protein [Phycisphaerales bacterium]|nr:GC-type dockerin domain-anchored protein [Phycisphaerales bacterium]